MNFNSCIEIFKDEMKRTYSPFTPSPKPLAAAGSSMSGEAPRPASPPPSQGEPTFLSNFL